MIHQIIIPDKRTIKISINVPENYIGQEVEVVAFIKNKKSTNKNIVDKRSPALQGDPLTNTDFLNWIKQAEGVPAITLQEAKNKWASKKKQLQELTK